MNRRRTTTPAQPPTPGFAIKIQPDTPLGLAMLIATDENGYRPVAVVSTINEAREMIEARRLPRKDTFYTVWAEGLDGYCVATSWPAAITVGEFFQPATSTVPFHYTGAGKYGTIPPPQPSAQSPRAKRLSERNQALFSKS